MICTKCGETKPPSEYYRRYRYCKACARRQMAAYASANRERVAEYKAGWLKANRERSRATRAALSPEQKWANLHRIRMARAGVPVGHTAAEWFAVVALCDGRCVYCGEPATTQDHVIPLSRGGDDGIENVVPACRSCNSSKKDKLPSEWSDRFEAVYSG